MVAPGRNGQRQIGKARLRNIPGAVEISYDVTADGAMVLVSVVTRFAVMVKLWYTVEAGAVKLLITVVVLAGKVSNAVDVYVLGARVCVVIEVNGIVIRSVKVDTAAMPN